MLLCDGVALHGTLPGAGVGLWAPQGHRVPWAAVPSPQLSPVPPGALLWLRLVAAARGRESEQHLRDAPCTSIPAAARAPGIMNFSCA